jgi:hypothetical protein
MNGPRECPATDEDVFGGERRWMVNGEKRERDGAGSFGFEVGNVVTALSPRDAGAISRHLAGGNDHWTITIRMALARLRMLSHFEIEAGTQELLLTVELECEGQRRVGCEYRVASGS